MNTLNERGMARLQDWLKVHSNIQNDNCAMLYAWAAEAERSSPPMLELGADLSVYGRPVVLRFEPGEYFDEAKATGAA